MDRNQLIRFAEEFVRESELNAVAAENAILPKYVGKRFFDAPLVGFAAAKDPIFAEFKKKEIVGPHFLTPEEWLPGCKTVVSFFLPFTKEVAESNAEDFKKPSALWLHARIEGQGFVKAMSERIVAELVAEGFKAMSPALDARIFSSRPGSTDVPPFSTNWPERHAAYAAGLGTFGLSRGLITDRGMAGRIGSVLTDAELEPNVRSYSQPYQNCTHCGACIRNCPVSAISIEGGKDNVKCNAFLDKTREEFNPRYGCGKCQVKVPCAYRNPMQ